MRSSVFVAAALLAVWWPYAALAQDAAAPLVVNSAEPDGSGESVVISGARFGRRPFVTLDLVPLTVQFATDSRIVASAPTNMIPAGEYLLTVTRGASPGDTASVTLTLGPGRGPAATSPAPAPAADRLPAPAPGDPAARVGERTMTVEDVDREWQRTDPAGYLALSRALYEQRRRVVDAMVGDDLIRREAEARGTTPDALLAEEIPKRAVPLPDSAVAALYQSLGDRVRGASLEQMRPALRTWLERNTEREMARMHFVEELMRVSTRAEVLLEAPRVEVESARLDQALGPESAAVELVAFGDFYSLEYIQFAAAFGRVREHFGDRLRIVFKHLPMTAPESPMAAEAAACASEQGRFWPYHDAVLAVSGPLGDARLKQIAGEVGLDRSAFDPCLDGGRFRDAVRDTLDESARYAIVASPSFLVNGRLAPAPPSFLPPFAFFTRLIEEELHRQSQAVRGR